MRRDYQTWGYVNPEPISSLPFLSLDLSLFVEFHQRILSDSRLHQLHVSLQHPCVQDQPSSKFFLVSCYKCVTLQFHILYVATFILIVGATFRLHYTLQIREVYALQNNSYQDNFVYNWALEILLFFMKYESNPSSVSSLTFFLLTYNKNELLSKF